VPGSGPIPARLLVADDEEGLLFLMVDALRREGYEVEGFESGSAAFEWLKRESVDLLLLDLKLGDIPAPELVERLRQQGRNVPFVIVTGHGDERTVVEVMKQGALDYVMKDAGMLDLLPGVVRRALAVVEREKKLAEANRAIRQSEERHQRIIQTALDGFIRFRKNGDVLEVNETMCELLGYSPDEILGQNVLEMQAEAFRKEVRERISGMKSEGAVRCFTSMCRKDSTLVEVELSLRSEDGEVFGFVHDISEQRHLEREVLKSVLEERSRFGRELHDGLGQQLTALEMMTHGLVRGLKSVAPEQAKAAQEISMFIRRAVTQTRQLAHGLAPVGVEAEGLMVSLNELARMTTSAGVQCEFECPEPVRIPESTVASHLYRVAQEAVTNALKHAKANQIAIRLEERDDEILLSIRDNGRGLPKTRSPKVGMGLDLLRHRARLIGGRLTIDSKPGRGVRIICSLPKDT
jgi:PAS domain S-box-containing protein